jgi:hypothetical protein
MTIVRGNKLNSRAQQEALRTFVHRNTTENPHRIAVHHQLPPISDVEWLAITDFQVTKSGNLDKRARWCLTHHSEIPEWDAIINKRFRSGTPVA